MKPIHSSFVFLLLTPVLFFSCTPRITAVYAVLETDAVATEEDAADDPAIFIHPTNPSKCAIIGTDKDKGLSVYDTQGKMIRHHPFGRLNNVDLRQNVAWRGEKITIVGASNRTDNTVVFYQLDEQSLELHPMHEQKFVSQVDEVYGFCLYHNGGLYAFVVGKDGQVEQWMLSPGPESQLEAAVVRSFDVGTQCEGLVADDELAYLYVGEETVGIWKYGANPEDGDARTLIDAIRENKYLKSDVEGLTIYYGENGTGYLLASIQGNNSYAVYERDGENDYLLSFRIKNGEEIDGTSETDGIDVASQPFGQKWMGGIFVAQDGRNGRQNQNFKIVDWMSIEKVIQAGQ